MNAKFPFIVFIVLELCELHKMRTQTEQTDSKLINKNSSNKLVIVLVNQIEIFKWKNKHFSDHINENNVSVLFCGLQGHPSALVWIAFVQKIAFF